MERQRDRGPVVALQGAPPAADHERPAHPPGGGNGRRHHPGNTLKVASTRSSASASSSAAARDDRVRPPRHRRSLLDPLEGQPHRRVCTRSRMISNTGAAGADDDPRAQHRHGHAPFAQYRFGPAACRGGASRRPLRPAPPGRTATGRRWCPGSRGRPEQPARASAPGSGPRGRPPARAAGAAYRCSRWLLSARRARPQRTCPRAAAVCDLLGAATRRRVYARPESA